MVLGNNEKNNYYDYNEVRNYESKNKDEENYFEDQIDEDIEVTPKSTLNPKVARVIKNM